MSCAIPTCKKFKKDQFWIGGQGYICGPYASLCPKCKKAGWYSTHGIGGPGDITNYKQGLIIDDKEEGSWLIINNKIFNNLNDPQIKTCFNKLKCQFDELQQLLESKK